jgi:hypothetical protein
MNHQTMNNIANNTTMPNIVNNSLILQNGVNNLPGGAPFRENNSPWRINGGSGSRHPTPLAQSLDSIN